MLISHYLEIAIIISFLTELIFEFPFPRAMFVKCGIIAALMLKIYIKSCSRFWLAKDFWKSFFDRKVDILNETLLIIFRNYIQNGKSKFNYCQPPRMNENIKRCMKERSKLTNFFYKNGQKREYKPKLEAKAACCTEKIMKAKNNYTLRMTNKLGDSKAAPRTYWSILNRFFYNKKIAAIPPPLPPFISKW